MYDHYFGLGPIPKPKPKMADTLGTIRNHISKGHNHGEKLIATSAMVDRICPPGGDRVKVSENLGGTDVEPVTPVDTSLTSSTPGFKFLMRPLRKR